MSKNHNLHTLFETLTDVLPHTYERQYVNGNDTEPVIAIYKKDSELTMYITMNTPDNNTINTTVYNGKPIETTQWDTNDPNFDLIDFITYIENIL